MNRQTIFLTGGSGFVGSNVISELLSRGHRVRALVNRKPIENAAVESVRGDLFDPASLDAALAGCDAVVHLVGIIFERQGFTYERVHVEGTRCLISAAKRAGIRRFVHMSALGARPNAIAEYHKTKFAAEESLRASGLDWTIFRPSLIHGPGGEFMTQEIAWARGKSLPWVAMPYFGLSLLPSFGRSPSGKIQPVYVKDVARAFADALEKKETIGQTYELGGAKVYSWPQMHRAAARVLVGKERPVMSLPAWYARLLASIVPNALLPFNKSQAQMASEDNVADLHDFEKDFGWTPGDFGSTLVEYAPSVGPSHKDLRSS